MHFKSLYDLIYKPVLFVCIGTPRAVGDSIGPRVGEKLIHSNLKNIKVLGTMDKPVHALNIKDTVKQIKREYSNHTVVAVDAFISDSRKFGEIIKFDGPIFPGAGVGKKLPAIGDCSIIINVSNTDYKKETINVLFDMDEEMACILADKLYWYIKKTHWRKFKFI